MKKTIIREFKLDEEEYHDILAILAWAGGIVRYSDEAEQPQKLIKLAKKYHGDFSYEE